MIIRFRRTLERNPQQGGETRRKGGRKNRVAFDHTHIRDAQPRQRIVILDDFFGERWTPFDEGLDGTSPQVAQDFGEAVIDAFNGDDLSVIVAKVAAVGPNHYGMDLALPENADVIGFCWFNDTVTSAAGEPGALTNDWRITSSKQAAAAFAVGIADPRYAAGR